MTATCSERPNRRDCSTSIGPDEGSSAGQERVPRQPHPPKELRALAKRAHPHLVTILTCVMPWVTLAAAVVFIAAWVTSLITGDPDEPALAMAGVMLAATGYAWLTRVAILSVTAKQQPQADPEP